MRIGVTFASLFFAAVIVGSWGSFDYFQDIPRAGLIIGLLVLPFFWQESRAMGRGKDQAESTWQFVLLILTGTVGPAILFPFCDARGIGNVALPSFLRYSGLVLVYTGYGVRRLAIHTLKRQFSYFVTVQENHQLITTGIYSLIRHPIYLGAILSLLGFAFIFPSVFGFLFVLIYFILLSHRMTLEERLLMKHFGAVYQEYSSKSFRLIPHVY